MENQSLDRDLKAKFKKNWRLFKQSKLGMTGLTIVLFFGIKFAFCAMILWVFSFC